MWGGGVRRTPAIVPREASKAVDGGGAAAAGASTLRRHEESAVNLRRTPTRCGPRVAPLYHLPPPLSLSPPLSPPHIIDHNVCRSWTN
jgi:hypothetical protein